MDDLECWKALEQYTLKEAVLLFIGENPAPGRSDLQYLKDRKLKGKYVPAKRLFIEAIQSAELPAEKVHREEGKMPEHYYESRICMESCTVCKKDIETWLRSNEIPSEFFEESGQPGYLNPKHERYAPKLAAAVHAWLAMQDGELLRKTTPSMALEKWLGEHATEYLKDKDVFTPTAIGECARIANWKRGGPTEIPN